MEVIWLTVFAAQLVLCLYLGYRVARRTNRSPLNWLFVGFLAAVAPIVGPILMIVCVLWYPPNPNTPPRRPDEHAATRRPGQRS